MVAGATVACGLDESGLDPGDAAIDVPAQLDGPTQQEAGPDVADDVALPPACATTDVTCLGFDAGLPDGWSPYVVEPDGGACPAGDFAATPWQANARLASGACVCNCSTTGAWSCPPTIQLSNGGACGTTFTVDAGECNVQQPVSQHLELATAPAATGNVACTSDASAPAASSDPVTLCAPGCDAGATTFCSQPSSQRCIATDGIQPCPSTGLVPHVVGSGPVAACNGCSCATPTPTCSATAHVYNGYNNGGYQTNDKCQTGGQWQSQTLALDNTCQTATKNYESFDVEWNALDNASCNPSGGGGDAGVASPKTVCCSP